MKRIFLVVIVFSIQFLNAQVQDIQRANCFFEKTYYSTAIPLYEKVVDDNPTFDVIKNLADSYYYVGDYVNAQKCYGKLFSKFKNVLGQDDYFRYSESLKASGNYSEANKIYLDYLTNTNNEFEKSIFGKNIKILANITALGKRFEIKNLAINTPNSEFGGFLLKKNLVFSGVMDNNGLFDKKFKWNNEKYLDLVAVPFDKINSADAVVNLFSNEIKTSMHESNAVFTKDGKTMYFTRNNYKKGRRAKNKDRVSNLQIFKAEFINDQWSNITSLSFNSDNYSVEHPALSNDERTLYFASDMPGTLGSLDIFKVEIMESGFGDPVNLGPNINTVRKEQFPYVAKDDKLYFSSNGRGGYGSLDVFVADIKTVNSLEAVNVGLPVNSGFDDFAFIIDSDTKEGFFSSNRGGGKGSDDIYQLKETMPLVVEDCIQYISGIAIDVDTKLPLTNAIISLQNKDKVEIKQFNTLGDGAFRFTVDCDSSYTVLGAKENYTNDSKSFQLYQDRKKDNITSLSLRSKDAIFKEEQLAVKEKEKRELLVSQRKKREEIALKERKAQEEKVAKEELVKEKEIKKRAKLDQIVTTEKDVVKEKDRLIIKTDPIYFDYNLWYIRKEAKIILNRVVVLLNKYPEMVIEVGSHTDNRGDGKYNLKLSSNRAESTREYIVSQGIDSKRIFAKGYGESIQIVKCIPSDSCSEEQHELNRRSEFVIKDL
ncbi:OmpA family protein [Flavobacterium algicola]|uniref:OmpA family protein n=1 Tax=Flavobacterium algicola TaxID=556529 RepID=UPI001EFD05BA|nr:OmpA family protein [Flavobacterium algicola]MCG9794053.1 OmpA family protein [Flavobacterium algicola]